MPASFHALLGGRLPDEPGGEAGEHWVARLPQLITEHLDRWELHPDGAAWHGECAMVLPVTATDGSRAALKLTWPHVEAGLEHIALRAWGGRGAVTLLAAHPAEFVLLLERLDGDRTLREVPILEACEIVGGLFGELDRPCPAPVAPVSSKATRWREQLSATSAFLPRRLTGQARATLDDLLAGAPSPRLVHEDLHDGNVLAADRADWLAIDPKPVGGEWAYAVAPIVWNRPGAAARATSLRRHVQLRADIVADVAGLDRDRVYAWTFVRLVLNAVWAADYAPASGDFAGRMIALAKAFADGPD